MFYGVPAPQFQVNINPFGLPAVTDPLFWQTYNAFAVPPSAAEQEALSGLRSQSKFLASLLPMVFAKGLQGDTYNLADRAKASLANMFSVPPVSNLMLSRLTSMPLMSTTERDLLRQALLLTNTVGLPPDIQNKLSSLQSSVESQTQAATQAAKRALMEDVAKLTQQSMKALAEQAAASGMLSSGGHMEAARRVLEDINRQAAGQLADLTFRAMAATLPLKQQALGAEVEMLSRAMAQKPDWLRLAFTIASMPHERMKELAQLAPNLEMAMRTAMLQPISLALDQAAREANISQDWFRTGLSASDVLKDMFLRGAYIGGQVRNYATDALQRAYEDWLRRQEIFQHLPFQRLIALFQLLEPKTFMPQYAPSLTSQLASLLPLLILPQQYTQSVPS